MDQHEIIEQFEQAVRALHAGCWTTPEIQALVQQTVRLIADENTRHLMKGLAVV